jgi:lipooligosaccharide transport system ATP-binding protein
VLRPARPERRGQDHDAALLPRPHGAGLGQIELAGLPVPQAAREARYRVGVVPQFDNLDPDFTVTENLVIFARYFGIPAARGAPTCRAARVRGPRRQAGAKIDALSGGMKRRLTLARALVNDPQVILDEPTTGLDPQARHLIWDRLKRTARRRGKTLILTTHFMDEAERLCDHGSPSSTGRMRHRSATRRAQLIAEHVEPEVVEVYGDDARRLGRR